MTKAECLAAVREDKDLTQVDGLDDAILGVVDLNDDQSMIAYSYQKCIEYHMDTQGMEYNEAREWIDFNYPMADIIMVYDHYFS